MPTRSNRASINDVARAAGVSVGTVSNVLNRPDRVLPATRDRVLAAIDELAFVPNGSARQLRAGTLTTVGAVVLDIANPFFTEVVRGIEDRLAADSYTLMLASSDEDPQREARYLRLFEEHGVSGMMVVPSGDDLDMLLALRDRGTPLVLLDRSSPREDISSVAVDDVLGGRLAVEHLLGLGHRRVAMINGPRAIGQCADRWAGAVLAVTEAGLDPATVLTEVTVASLNAASGEQATSQLLAERGRRPTAIFCVNDLTALGVLRALRDHRVRVPDDLAVVGYDDIGFATELAIPLTSVRQPTHDLGFRAADLLLDRTSVTHQVLFSPELVVRASSSA